MIDIIKIGAVILSFIAIPALLLYLVNKSGPYSPDISDIDFSKSAKKANNKKSKSNNTITETSSTTTADSSSSSCDGGGGC